MSNAVYPETTSNLPTNSKLDLSIRGLGILTFNDESAEFGCLNVGGHTAKIAIQEIVGSQTNDLLLYQPLAGRNLVIETDSHKAGWLYDGASNGKSYTNIVDLTEFYDSGAKIKSSTTFDDGTGGQVVPTFQSVLRFDGCTVRSDDNFNVDAQPINHSTGAPAGDQRRVTRAIRVLPADGVAITKISLGGVEVSTQNDLRLIVQNGCRRRADGTTDPEDDFRFTYNALENPVNPRVNLTYPVATDSNVDTIAAEYIAPLRDYFPSDSDTLETFSIGKTSAQTALRMMSNVTDFQAKINELQIDENAKESLKARSDFFFDVLCEPQGCLGGRLTDRARSLT